MIAAAAMSPPMIQTTMEAMLIPISPDSSASLSENSKSASIMASNATFRFGAPVAPISSAPIAPGVFVDDVVDRLELRPARGKQP